MGAPISLVVVRHGESATNAANVFTGWSNPPLTAIGRDEAARVAHRIREARLAPSRIFSSPASRATETVASLKEVQEATETP